MKTIDKIKNVIMNIGKKRISLVFGVIVMVLTVLGGTFAFWGWSSTNAEKTVVNFTVEKDFECSADVGGYINPSDVPLAPTTCDSAKHVIKREMVVNVDVLGHESVYMDLRLDINDIAPELSDSTNLRYSLTTSDASCTDGVVVSGTFNGLTNEDGNNKIELFKQKEYTETTEEIYYLYIWLDAEETNLNTAGKGFDLSINGECTDGKRD